MAAKVRRLSFSLNLRRPAAPAASTAMLPDGPLVIGTVTWPVI